MQGIASQQASDHERDVAQLRDENALLKNALEQSQNALSEVQASHQQLHRAYTRALEELALLHRRLFIQKAERAEHSVDQLTLENLLSEVKRLEKELDAAERESAEGLSASNGDEPTDKPKTKPKGRRGLSDAESDLPKTRVEILDPELEGKVSRIGWDLSYRLAYEPGGLRRVEVATATYKRPATEDEINAKVEEAKAVAQAENQALSDEEVAHVKEASLWRMVRAPSPREAFKRPLFAPSLVAHLLVQKYMMSVPFYRLEKRFALQGVSIDRATMCRYAEDAGATLGCIVEAARKEALETAFCLSTDATGVLIQPERMQDQDRQRQRCDNGHFFVVLADRDHVFFDYQREHTSAVVSSMFAGYRGYIQADAHAIYDALFRPPEADDESMANATAPPIEVGCWSHCRRKFWEAAVCKHALGVEGLRRIDVIFAADRLLKSMPPSRRKVHRDKFVRPLVDAFFTWAEAEFASVHERGLVRTALGYAVRQQSALRRFLADGRLALTNNSSERALRSIAVGRKNWLFIGSDDHGNASANLFSLIASCKLHRVDPEGYLTDILRVLPHWPREHYLELAPKYWAQTRARLDPKQLTKPLGTLDVPLPLPAQEQTTPN